MKKLSFPRQLILIGVGLFIGGLFSESFRLLWEVKAIICIIWPILLCPPIIVLTFLVCRLLVEGYE